jgi:hypothetical protein
MAFYFMGFAPAPFSVLFRPFTLAVIQPFRLMVRKRTLQTESAPTSFLPRARGMKEGVHM